MSLILKIGDKSYEVDREELQSQLAEKASEILTSSKGDPKATTMKLAVKGAMTMLFTVQGIQIPKGVDTLEYGIGWVMALALDGMEKQPIRLHAREVVEAFSDKSEENQREEERV